MWRNLLRDIFSSIVTVRVQSICQNPDLDLSRDARHNSFGSVNLSVEPKVFLEYFSVDCFIDKLKRLIFHRFQFESQKQVCRGKEGVQCFKLCS